MPMPRSLTTKRVAGREAGPAASKPPRGTARTAALRALALRRLTEAQLRERLLRKGFEDDAVEEAVAACKSFGYLDDQLFAQLYVDGRRKAVGDARLVAELVKRGIDREAAIDSVARAVHDEDARLTLALEKILRSRPDLAYPNCARALERLGFPASAIYRHLRLRAAAELDCGLTPPNSEIA